MATKKKKIEKPKSQKPKAAASPKLKNIRKQIREINKKKNLSKDDKRKLAALKAWQTRLEQGWQSKPRTPKKEVTTIEVPEKKRKQAKKNKRSKTTKKK